MYESNNSTAVKHSEPIHAIWLGDRLPPLAQVCIDDWRKQGYTYKLWLETDPKIKAWIEACEFAKKCYEKGLYAFVTDYLRLKILADEGGLYLDTDVTIDKNPFSLFMPYDFCVGYEAEGKIGTAIIYAKKNSAHLALLIEFYENKIMKSELYMGPDIMTYFIESDEKSNNIKVFDKCFFYDYSGEKISYSPNPSKYMTHWFQHSWKRSKGLVFLKSKSKGILGALYEYQKEFFRFR
ncbi:glycosyltransferase family 32 protein [Aeromonas sobria]|uniref:glycosyltransferase family 32 protein n=1 Tax=Aeromonas sobria TaxID=646 RepID=UPI003F405510